jgi:hypothetical protein
MLYNKIIQKMFEAMGLKLTASRSPTMASPPYKISSKSTNRFKSYYGGFHRQAGDVISLLSSFRK